jgi:pterin-4a-carbinolamine dehydratase
MVADDTVDLAAKTREILSLHERDTQMAEAEAVSVLAEARTDRHAQLAER